MKSEKCKFPKNSKEHLRSRWTLSRRAKLLFPAWAGIVLLSRKPEPELWMFLLRTKFEFTGVVLYFCFPGTWRHRKRSHLSKLIGAFFNWFSGNDVGLRFLGSFLIVQSANLITLRNRNQRDLKKLKEKKFDTIDARDRRLCFDGWLGGHVFAPRWKLRPKPHPQTSPLQLVSSSWCQVDEIAVENCWILRQIFNSFQLESADWIWSRLYLYLAYFRSIRRPCLHSKSFSCPYIFN